MLQLDNIHLYYGQHQALRGVGLSISQGSQLAIIGPSGSGKSSLLKLIATEHNPSAGTLGFGEQNPIELSSKELQLLRQSISYIPQHLALIPNLNVAQNVFLGEVGKRSTLSTLKNLLFPNKGEIERIHSILTEVGIEEKIFHRTDTLSGGQQQRVAIARALFQRAKIILADEPVSAVDPSRAHSLLECLTTVASDHNLTLLCSLHNLDYAKRFFPKIIGMRNGEITLEGASSDFNDQDFASLYSLENG